MSRASNLRDEVKDAIASALPTNTVEVFLVPRYSREELQSGPRIVVRTGGRDVRTMQGPDERDVIIEVGIVGATPESKSSSESINRAAVVAAGDAFDGLMEQVIALWSPNGTLSRYGLAEHRFVGISQAINFDPNKLYNDGVWLSLIQLTYQDSIDE